MCRRQYISDAGFDLERFGEPAPAIQHMMAIVWSADKDHMRRFGQLHTENVASDVLDLEGESESRVQDFLQAKTSDFIMAKPAR